MLKNTRRLNSVSRVHMSLLTSGTFRTSCLQLGNVISASGAQEPAQVDCLPDLSRVRGVSTSTIVKNYQFTQWTAANDGFTAAGVVASQPRI